MVAAAKMRKAQNAALSGRPYTTLLNQMLENIQKDTSDLSSPLMETRPVKAKAVLIVEKLPGPLFTITVKFSFIIALCLLIKFNMVRARISLL